ncbi:hypothetical protein PR048_023155 [Dryococelus australis]|uniref:Transmembrane protein n=1 Tax=Dryococelus australis TaxID=614101 RepID=A0ABQ9GTA5_9NEOP|nr:hypothetical protein PR048_023155 [Dryococelus australis]
MLRLTDPRYRYYTYIYISVWKMLLFFCAMLLAVYQNQPTKDTTVPFMFSDFLPSFESRHVLVVEVQPIMLWPNTSDVMPEANNIEMEAWPLAPVWVFVVHVVSAYLCYIFAKFACKIRIQVAGLALPVNLAVPVSISLLVVVCGLRNSDPCYFRGFLPDYMSFAAPDIYNLEDFIVGQHAWVWLLWLVSQMWITIHLCSPQADALASTDKLFVIPLYNSFLIDQSISMNRKRKDKDISIRREVGSTNNSILILRISEHCSKYQLLNNVLAHS